MYFSGRLAVFFTCLWISLSVAAQKEYARKILDTLCSPHFDGRGYVNGGDVRSANFIAEELHTIGVQRLAGNSFFQEYSFGVNTFPRNMLVVIGQDTLVPGEEFLVHEASGSAKGKFGVLEFSPATMGERFELSPGIFDRDRKIPLINFCGATSEQKLKAKEFALKLINFMPCMWVESDKQCWSVCSFDAKYPMIMIDSVDFAMTDSVELDIENLFIRNYKTKNVVGLIPGKKKKMIVFSAHLDHLGRMGKDTYFPGANDNASGVAMLLSIAKHFIESPPKYNLLFCFFTGEEAGMKGSEYFVNHPMVYLNKIKMVVNIDILGGASDGITVVNAPNLPKQFGKLVSLNDSGRFLGEVKSRNQTQNSDHYYFSESGVPAFFIYSNGTVKNYHDVFDTAENTPLDKFDEVRDLLIKFVESL